MLAFFLLTVPPHPPKPGEVFVSNEIGLTGENKKAVDALEKKHHKLKRSLMRKNKMLHENLYENLGNKPRTWEIIEEIHSNQREIESITYSFFEDVNSHCNTQQKKKLKKFIHTSLHFIFGGPPGPHGPPGPPRRR